MTAIELDHTIVPSRDKAASAALLARLLDVPYAPALATPTRSLTVGDARPASA